MLFDEINIETITHNEDLYINVEQLLNHIVGSSEHFSHETAVLAKQFGITRDEKYFTMGLIQGMLSIAIMLRQGNHEFEFDSVETVEDLLQKFWTDSGEEKDNE
jgi:hypothetical protein